MNLFNSILNRKSVINQQKIAKAQLAEVVDRHKEAADRLVASVKALLEENDTIRLNSGIPRQ